MRRETVGRGRHVLDNLLCRRQCRDADLEPRHGNDLFSAGHYAMSRDDIRWAMAAVIADRIILFGSVAIFVWLLVGGAA